MNCASEGLRGTAPEMAVNRMYLSHHRPGRLRREDDCGRCGHGLARHVATLASPDDGGYPCGVFGCDCTNYRELDHGSRTLLEVSATSD